MSWKIRMHISASKGSHRHSRSVSSSSITMPRVLNQATARVEYFTRRPQIILSHRCANGKRARSNETIPEEETGKKAKPNVEPSRLVLVCGQNICGQLGLPSAIIERHKPQHLRISDRSNTEEKIQSICAGAMHSCALTASGRVYTWGCNDDGALGRTTHDIDEEYRLDLCVLPEDIKALCAGDSFTVALAKSGRAYISGCFRSSGGVLGLFEHRQMVPEPSILPFDHLIKSIACGADFCLLLTENGELYSFGNNEIGQLGRDAHSPHVEQIDDETVSTWLRPSPVSSFRGQRVLDIWAGGHGFFARVQQSSRSHLYACGANSFGQLGHSSKQAIYSPVRVESVSHADQIVKIACGLQHTLILDTAGQVFGLGRSDDGRLGSSTTDDVLIPQLIAHLSDIIDIAAGGSVSFAIDSHGLSYSFGMGDTCQTGHGEKDVFLPTLMQSKQLTERQVEQISVGAQHTLLLVKEKDISG